MSTDTPPPATPTRAHLLEIARHAAHSSSPGLAAIARHYLTCDPAAVRADERRRVAEWLAAEATRVLATGGEVSEAVAAVLRTVAEYLWPVEHLTQPTDSTGDHGTGVALL